MARTVDVVEDPNIAFAKVYEKALRYGVKPSDFKKLRSIDTIRQNSSRSTWTATSYILLGISILLCLFGVQYQFNVFTGENLVKTVRSITKPISDTCIVDFHIDWVSHVFRRVEDCSVCRDFHEIDRVSNISPEDFQRKYIGTGRPVIITDAQANWTSVSIFTYEYLRKLYSSGNDNERTKEARCWFSDFGTGVNSVKDVFAMSEDQYHGRNGTKPWYVGWRNCDTQVANELRRHYGRPYFLPKTSETKRLDWWFMGSKDYGATVHVDNVGYWTWQAQFRGRKLWTLKPPRECTKECPSQVQATVDPGEIIVFDSDLWYHGTKIIGDEVSLSLSVEFD